MRKDIWEKRIPTLLGLFLIIIGIGVTSFLVKSGVIIVSKASPPHVPENVRITNVSDSSFTVSYSTKDSVIGTVSFGQGKDLGNVAVDDRDQKIEKISPYKLHYITIKKLAPNTKYYFSITSAQETFLRNDAPFEVKTAPAIETSPPTQNPMVGKILLPDGTNPKESIVYVKSSNSQTLSVLVKEDGNYILPLNSARNQDLLSYFSFDQNSAIQIMVIGDGMQSEASILPTQINPIPSITLSKDYDFTISDSSIASSSATTASTSASTNIGFPSFSVKSATKDPLILTPKKDESFSDQQPLFKGTTSPNENIEVIIHSASEIKEKIKSDLYGNWSYRPSSPLAPGTHTISIIAKDKFGVLKTITQSFTVYAQGSQVSESATPSATPTITIKITATPSLTVTPTPTLEPTVTPTPSFNPTPTPSPTPILVIKKIAPPPSPGSSSLVVVTIGALLTIVVSGLFFLVSRGSISL